MRPIALLQRPSRLVVGLGQGWVSWVWQWACWFSLQRFTPWSPCSRLDAWCGARSRRRLLMIVAMALLTALALWVEILLSVAEAVNGMLMAGWSKAQLVYVVQRITLLPLVSEGRLP